MKKITLLITALLASTSAFSAPIAAKKISDFCMADVCLGDDHSKFPEAKGRIGDANRDLARSCLIRETTYQNKAEYDTGVPVKGVEVVRNNERIYLDFNYYLKSNGKLSYRVEHIHYLESTPASMNIITSYLTKFSNLDKKDLKNKYGQLQEVQVWSNNKETAYIYYTAPGGYGGPARLDLNYFISQEAQIELGAKVKSVQANCITNKQL